MATDGDGDNPVEAAGAEAERAVAEHCSVAREDISVRHARQSHPGSGIGALERLVIEWVDRDDPPAEVVEEIDSTIDVPIEADDLRWTPDGYELSGDALARAADDDDDDPDEAAAMLPDGGQWVRPFGETRPSNRDPLWIRDGGDGLPVPEHTDTDQFWLFTCCQCGRRWVDPPAPVSGCGCGSDEIVCHRFDPDAYWAIKRHGDPRVRTDGGRDTRVFEVVDDCPAISYGPDRHRDGKWCLAATTGDARVELLLGERAMYDLWTEVRGVPWPTVADDGDRAEQDRLVRQLVHLANGADAEMLKDALAVLGDPDHRDREVPR